MFSIWCCWVFCDNFNGREWKITIIQSEGDKMGGTGQNFHAGEITNIMDLFKFWKTLENKKCVPIYNFNLQNYYTKTKLFTHARDFSTSTILTKQSWNNRIPDYTKWQFWWKLAKKNLNSKRSWESCSGIQIWNVTAPLGAGLRLARPGPAGSLDWRKNIHYFDTNNITLLKLFLRRREQK